MTWLCPRPCENKTADGYCGTSWCINPMYSNIGTANEKLMGGLRKTTNADLIRAMSDEELAVQIAWPYLGSPPWCAEHTTCPYISEDPTPCDKCALDWLKQEADNGEN